jgi:hypothetical protein
MEPFRPILAPQAVTYTHIPASDLPETLQQTLIGQNLAEESPDFQESLFLYPLEEGDKEEETVSTVHLLAQADLTSIEQITLLEHMHQQRLLEELGTVPPNSPADSSGEIKEKSEHSLQGWTEIPFERTTSISSFDSISPIQDKSDEESPVSDVDSEKACLPKGLDFSFLSPPPLQSEQAPAHINEISFTSPIQQDISDSISEKPFHKFSASPKISFTRGDHSFAPRYFSQNGPMRAHSAPAS